MRFEQKLQPQSTEEKVLLHAVGNPHVSIVLPTFNESKNVVELLALIADTMRQTGHEYECIFVDDSHDATPSVIQAAARLYPGRITLIKRTGALAKTGLTMAFKRGFKEARGAIIVCMDTDLQHPPATIARLVQVVSENPVDVVVASRYTRGGSAEGLNGFFRKFVSKASNYFVWLLLPSTRRTTDPMTGFFAFRRTLLTRVSFSSLGFKILVELLAALDQPKVIDIPFTFEKRREEVSKATLRQGIVAYRDIFYLFLTGSRGSVLIKVLLVAGAVLFVHVVGIAIAMFLTVGGARLPYFDIPVMHLFTGALIVLAMVPLVRFALARYHYYPTTPKNLGLISMYATLVAVMVAAISPWLATHGGGMLAPAIALFVALVGVYVVLQPLWQKKSLNLISFERVFITVAVVVLFFIFSFFLDFTVWWSSLLLGIYLLVVVQGLFALFLMIYAWENEDNTKAGRSDGTFLNPLFSFTAIVPCKHEKNTIADTIRAMHAIEYPADKKQVLVVIHEGTDDGTIDIVRDTITELQVDNIQLVTYNETPVNKPHGLNKALAVATGDFVAIFDAEDEPHPDLFRVVNTALINTQADVMQSGVQLMNYESNWYSIFNVLEYYFWFKSSLHFYAKNRVAPLGGVSVFFRRTMLQKVGGWDMSCLTEDAEVGIRLSQIGAKISVIYSAEYATREETPPTLVSFVKQRTRWAQGFLQILARGSYREFPTFKQRFLALYILSWPLIIPFAALLLPFGIIMMSVVSLPPALALLSNVPLLLFIGFILTLVLGFYEFTREYKYKFSPYYVLVIVLFFYPYTLLLVIASLRAIYRNLANITVWEKTEHVNKHREGRLPVLEPVLTASVPE
jgi:cellulose synthase/poly-beta-1,6-N-acetylglucosamine synthase-like glycosyltransferase